MSPVTAEPGLRAAHRSKDPAVLGATLASQLVAYRCSTVYGPTDALVREVIEQHALPRLEAEHEIRRVVIAGWPAGGPSLAHLISELHRQLELSPVEGAEQTSVAALRGLLARAHRVSDRPLVIVLLGLEHLLDDDRDPAADLRLIDALTALVELPMHGLQLVMAVREIDLGGFRHLLRGRWRLLANDIRIHADDRRMIVPIPLASSTVVAAGAAAAAAGRGGLLMALGGLVGAAGLVLAGINYRAAAAAEAALDACQATTCPTCRECPPPPPTVQPEPVPKDMPPEPDPPEPVAGDPVAIEPVAIDPVAIDPVAIDPIALDPDKPKANTMCTARADDGPCAACVRGSCCSQLRSCKSQKWRSCVLTGSVPSDACSPEAIEKDCRTLALCALEYECNAVCYNK